MDCFENPNGFSCDDTAASLLLPNDKAINAQSAMSLRGSETIEANCNNKSVDCHDSLWESRNDKEESALLRHCNYINGDDDISIESFLNMQACFKSGISVV